MISPRALDLAVQRGVVTPEQADRLQAIEREAAPEPQDAERLRFVSGFGDVFVTIGLALFLGSIAWFAWETLGVGSWGRVAAAVVMAAASWALAEVFTRRRRMALPSIALLLAFAASVLAAGLLVGAHGVGTQRADMAWKLPTGDAATVVAGAMAFTAGAVALHYWRFRVPITVAVGMAALVWALFAVSVALAPDVVAAWWRPILFACGAAIFALALRIDRTDPRRLTRRTDIAFWLHLLAAPLIVHTLIGGLIVQNRSFGVTTALGVLACFLVLALVAVLADRRAILVAGLAYAGIAFATLFRQTAFADSTVPATLLVLGIFVLALSIGWQPLRAALLGTWTRRGPPHRGKPSRT